MKLIPSATFDLNVIIDWKVLFRASPTAVSAPQKLWYTAGKSSLKHHVLIIASPPPKKFSTRSWHKLCRAANTPPIL